MAITDTGSATRSVTVEYDVPARMRDGVVLRANIYRPTDGGPWPVLLMRGPYGKDAPLAKAWFDPERATARGFIVVVQDTRGRFASEGEWDPFLTEREDGYDSVEWAAALPGSNGRVGMFHGSYMGVTQWAAAAAQPPSLHAIAPAITGADPMEGMFGRGGAVELGIDLMWTLYTGAGDLPRRGHAEGDLFRRLDALIDDYDRLADEGYWELPIHPSALVARHGAPEVGSLRVLDDPTIAARTRVTDTYDDVTVASLNIGGWHDSFIQGTLDNYIAMAERGRDARLLVGPWSHAEWGDRVGELCFGLRAGRIGIPAHPHGDCVDFELAWMRSQLVPDDDVEMPEAPVRIFVMGRNEWRDEPCWPPADTAVQRHYLRSDGSLTVAEPAAGEPPTAFAYDPGDPVPTVGGPTVMSSAFPAGPRDQAAIEARDDVCVFTSAPLTDELEVTGRVRVVLHAESSAPSTDWVARLCDVDPNGRSLNLCDGILRVTHDADGLARHEIDLWSTSNVFLAGHRIRVHVTSSSFPRWDRNLNTGDQRTATYKTAHQSLHHDTQQPSYIELPARPT